MFISEEFLMLTNEALFSVHIPAISGCSTGPAAPLSIWQIVLDNFHLVGEQAGARLSWNVVQWRGGGSEPFTGYLLQSWAVAPSISCCCLALLCKVGHIWLAKLWMWGLISAGLTQSYSTNKDFWSVGASAFINFTPGINCWPFDLSLMLHPR